MIQTKVQCYKHINKQLCSRRRAVLRVCLQLVSTKYNKCNKLHSNMVRPWSRTESYCYLMCPALSATAKCSFTITFSTNIKVKFMFVAIYDTNQSVELYCKHVNKQRCCRGEATRSDWMLRVSFNSTVPRTPSFNMCSLGFIYHCIQLNAVLLSSHDENSGGGGAVAWMSRFTRSLVQICMYLLTSSLVYT